MNTQPVESPQEGFVYEYYEKVPPVECRVRAREYACLERAAYKLSLPVEILMDSILRDWILKTCPDVMGDVGRELIRPRRKSE